ncbi:hypothetical protein F5Y05DRAFT_413677 [Hypoxylon sp. FL0543]|nr:hypothetical protein F5Y05DRAFT_413677 [Hypoxylon sp. FL0543]
MASNPPNLPHLPSEDVSPHVGPDDDPKIAAVAISMMVLSSILVFLRFTARSLQRGALGLDDWIILVSQALVILLLTTSIICKKANIHPYMCKENTKGFLVSQNGVGLDLPLALRRVSDVENIRKWLYIKEFAYVISITFIKLSILALYTRLFPTRFTVRSAKCLALVTVVWLITAIIASLFQCKPITSNWKFALNGTRPACSGMSKFFLAITISHIILDVFTLCLPIREIKGLQMRLWKKFAVSGIFIAGGFVTLISIIRVVLLVHAFDATSATLEDDTVGK